MVLRSGIILPFQFRDCKKLLMIGVPEENRDLSIWDLKNVVRAAFGIYNFEFRNKKIGFNIPDELLLQYLAQRHDLTNFVIEIGQGNDDMCMNLKEQLTYEPSCSQKLSIPLPQKSNESLTCDSAIMAATQMGQLYGNSPSSAMGVLTASMPLVTRNRSPPPPDCMENHSDHSSNLEPAHRMRSMCKPYNDNTPESLTQSMDPMDIIPKSEQDENELTDNREMHYERHNNQQEIQHQMPQEVQSIHQQQLQAITQSQQSSQQQFITNYGHHQANLLSNTINNVTPSSPHIPPPPITPQLTHMSNQPAQNQYSPNMMNRFRIFDPCKDNYHTLISNCFTCRCGSAQKQALDLHEPTKPLHHTNNSFNSNTASGSTNHQLNAPPPPSLAQPQTTTSSTSNSQHSHQSGGAEEPPLKLRITNISTLPVNSIAQAKNELVLESREQIEIEPKIDYDDLPSPSHMNTLDEEQQQQQQQQQQQTIGTSTLTENSPPSPSLAALALTSMAPLSDALNLHNQPDTDEETSYMERELNEQEMHLERMHEYFMQQQQQHLQQQQQQQHHPHHHHHHQQQHIEQFMQEGSSTNNLRQRKERMSKRQKEVYVNFLEQNPIINEHRRNDPALNRYWLKLADILNSVPQGAVKHVAEWKQTFDNWRYRVFLYARYNSKISGEEALIPKCFKPLTMTDKRAYNIWIRNPDTAPPDLEQMRNVFMNLEEAPHE